MSLARQVVQEAAFVDAAGGPRLRIVARPVESPCLGTVIWVHAFAEEMNKTRRMSARLARLLASDGWHVVQKDLCGCGDSAGDFSDASWAIWIEDIEAELRQADPVRPVWLWCVRAGALLASAALADHPRANLLLWQPVVSGAQHLQQFLRLQEGARIIGSAKGTSSPSPAQSLRDGVAVEVGGYLLTPALAQALKQASLDVPAAFAGRIVWFELQPDELPTVSPAATRVVEQMRARSVHVDVEALTGPAFWQTQEIEESDALLQRSRFALAGPVPALRPGLGATGVARELDRVSESRFQEQALVFRCGDSRIWGILARPLSPVIEASKAVLIAVGGPQYRVGSHRQFVHLARRLAEHGYSSLRFDYRGMGDSEGESRTFEAVGPDLHAAIDALKLACPAASDVVVWGLCDAASAAMLHAGSHPAVTGIVVVNPWARSDTSLAAAQVKYYYQGRILQREFWAKLVQGRLDVGASIGALLANLKQAWIHFRSMRSHGSGNNSFQSRMVRGVAGFRGRVLLIVAGEDLTAKEFLDFAGNASLWRGLLASRRFSRVDVPQADHTFSSRVWRRQVEDATISWLQGEGRSASP